jgi:FkbM family methyltransferase
MLMNALRRLTYQVGLLNLARALHLSAPLKKWYYRLVVPPDQILRLQVLGRDLKFYVRTPVELRDLETTPRDEEDFFTALASVLREGDAFFDVGSNLGKFAVTFAKVVGASGSVVAFEPELRCFDRLEENIRLNGLANVRAFRKALGQEDGEGKLLVAGTNNTGSSLLPVHSVASSATETVDVVPGDRFRDAEQLPVPRAIKIDVEGYEHYVLEGLKHTLSDPQCVMVCCEVHQLFLPSGITVETIEGLIRDCEFGSVEMLPRGQQIHLIATKGTPAHAAE